MKRIVFWNSNFGRKLCALITLNEHIFKGWKEQGFAGAEGEAYPFAYCVRCGAEF